MKIYNKNKANTGNNNQTITLIEAVLFEQDHGGIWWSAVMDLDLMGEKQLKYISSSIAVSKVPVCEDEWVWVESIYFDMTVN